MKDVKPKYIDFAVWPAIGGDHSISPEDMVHNILKTDWILKVADVAASLKNGIASAKRQSAIEGGCAIQNKNFVFIKKKLK